MRAEAVGWFFALLAAAEVAGVLGMALVKVGPAQLASRWGVVLLLALPGVWPAGAVWLARGCGPGVRRLAAGAAGLAAATLLLVLVQVASEFHLLPDRWRPLAGTEPGPVMAPAIAAVLLAVVAATVGRWRRPADPDGD